MSTVHYIASFAPQPCKSNPTELPSESHSTTRPSHIKGPDRKFATREGSPFIAVELSERLCQHRHNPGVAFRCRFFDAVEQLLLIGGAKAPSFGSTEQADHEADVGNCIRATQVTVIAQRL